MLQRISVGQGAASRTITVLAREGKGPPVVWLCGLKSDMRSTKASALDDWAAKNKRALFRFDYTGHGESGGIFEESTVSLWLEDTLSVIDRFIAEPPILVGSSMGGWLALLATRTLLARKATTAPKALVLIAPAVDFTERLMWDRFPDVIRDAISQTGVYHRPTPYGDEPYPITRELIEDGRRHLLLDGPVATGCPVHIIQGMQDRDVPYEHAMLLVEHLPGDDVAMTLIKDGDHRLSRPEDLEQLIATIERI